MHTDVKTCTQTTQTDRQTDRVIDTHAHTIPQAYLYINQWNNRLSCVWQAQIPAEKCKGQMLAIRN